MHQASKWPPFTLKFVHADTVIASMIVNATSAPAIVDVMLDFDSTAFALLDAMRLLPGGERITYEATKTWDYLIELCGPAYDEDDPATHLTHDQRLAIMLDLFDQAMELDHMLKIGLLVGCVEQIKLLHAAGARFHIVTDRPDARIDCTAAMLRKHGVPFASIQKVRSGDKAQWCINNGVSIMVDDHPVTITQGAAAGLTVMGLAYRFNAKEGRKAGVPLFADWTEMGPAIMAAVAKRSQCVAV